MGAESVPWCQHLFSALKLGETLHSHDKGTDLLLWQLRTWCLPMGSWALFRTYKRQGLSS